MTLVDMEQLLKKYSKQVPRYTSYPSVPYWKDNINADMWIQEVNASLKKDPSSSLYIHLPFCEALCHFCGCHKIISKNHDVEHDYIEALIQEWKIYLSRIEHKISLGVIHLGGGTPTFFHPENLQKLISSIQQNVHIPENIEYSYEAHPAITTDRHLQVLFDLGFHRISLGVQDFDPHVQKKISRFQSKEQVEFLVHEARRIGYKSINFDLIYGLPGQTKASLQETLAEVKRLLPDRIAFYSYAHVPWLKPMQRSFQDGDLPSPQEKLDLFLFAREAFAEMGYIELGMDHFVLPQDDLCLAKQNNTLYRNFMGYTDVRSQTNLALGVSSISEVDAMYAQNEKNLIPYYESIRAGRLPIVKGHSLVDEELFLKHMIQSIMCFGYLSWEGNERIRQAVEKNDRLVVFEQEGLIQIGSNQFVVTQLGNCFLRQISASFDPSYAVPEGPTKLFSQGI